MILGDYAAINSFHIYLINSQRINTIVIIKLIVLDVFYFGLFDLQ